MRRERRKRQPQRDKNSGAMSDSESGKRRATSDREEMRMEKEK